MDQVTTTTRVGNATITVTGVYAKDTQTTLKDIQKSLIQRHIISDYGVDLSGVQSEHVTQSKEVTA